MIVRLGDVCRFQSGGTPSKNSPNYYQGPIPWITTVALNGSCINESSAVEWITEKAIAESAAKVVPRNSIMVGTRVGVGKVAINTVPMSTSQDVISLLDIDESRWDKNYICKFILSKHDYLNSQARGATIKGIKIDVLAGLELPYISLAEQKEIAFEIDKASALVTLRKQQLAKLDELVKSRFVEMFGDLVRNPHGFTVVPLQELINRGMITYHLDGNHGGDYPRSEEFTAEGVPYIGANCIADGRIDFTMAKHLPPERAKRLRKGIAQHGDVLFAHNATVGPVVVLETQESKVILSTSLTAYRCNTESINPHYLSSYMRSDCFVNQYSAEMKQTTRNQVPITAQKKYLFMIPPIELQEQFAAFVEQTNKSKLTIQQSLDKLETLKKALMQKYFG